MPNACLSLWPTEDCEWSTWDIWRSADVIERAIYVSLALMLGYTFLVLIRFLLRYYRRSHELSDFNSESATDYLASRRRLIAKVSRGLEVLKAISTAAPFLGLAGTSYGILAALWSPYSGSPDLYFRLLFTGFAFALTTTLAGIFVALPAITFYNLLRIRIEHFSPTEFSVRASYANAARRFRFAETLPLRRSFSGLPAFPLLAAPFLASIAILFSPFHPYQTPTGLRVLLPYFPCRAEVSSRMIVLQVTRSGELSINQEPASRTDPPRRLAEIYRVRARRELYLRADDGASFQMVADAIDTATTIRRPEFNSLDLKLFLITPGRGR
jgi:biopolymer transport protein ExbD